MNDYICRQAAIVAIHELKMSASGYDNNVLDADLTCEILKEIPSADAQLIQWIPVEYHQITEEERQENDYPADWVYYIDSPMPEEGQEILITTNTGYVEKCTCLNDGESWYTDDDYDWCGEIKAWMPLPEPYQSND